MIWLFCRRCREDTEHDMFPRGNICRECGARYASEGGDEDEKSPIYWIIPLPSDWYKNATRQL